MVQTLSVIPSLLCTRLAACSLCSRRMRQLEMVVFAVLIGVGRNSLHMQATAVHGIILCIVDLLLLRHLDVQCGGFVLVKQIVEFVVCSAIHCRLLSRIHPTLTVVPTKNSFIVSQVWR